MGQALSLDFIICKLIIGEETNGLTVFVNNMGQAQIGEMVGLMSAYPTLSMLVVRRHAADLRLRTSSLEREAVGIYGVEIERMEVVKPQNSETESRL